ncbi:MAG: Mur ligase domain-containing protein [Candidatus Nomurabacteria bacterium]|jgi:UDP-N-acetylmuramate--alanine ligase|nr:Mur ligase domain-containing protein [Candidatus Nomurabacteria bacterium]
MTKNHKMTIYLVGIGGHGIGSLAEFLQDAGFNVFGSDANQSLLTSELQNLGIKVHIGEQTGDHLEQTNAKTPIDWVVHTSAVKPNHPELAKAKSLNLKITKRDQLIAFLVKELGLKMIAIAGTHGKTTTTSMLVWIFRNLGLPISYLIGAKVGWAKSGHFDPKSDLFIYEADEYDRNFLTYSPFASIITALDYDHVDIYPTREDYLDAFRQFISQSDNLITWQHIADYLNLPKSNTATFLDKISPEITLKGLHNRQNASLVLDFFTTLTSHYSILGAKSQVLSALNSYPSVTQRFERIAENLYSDYAHTLEEISATLQMAREIAKPNQKIVAIYMGLTNARQHEIIKTGGYKNAFASADQIYVIPTFLTREDPAQKVLTPTEIISNFPPKEQKIAQAAKIDNDFFAKIKSHLSQGDLVLLLAPDDLWLRNKYPFKT